jgi:hypothetical protein
MALNFPNTPTDGQVWTDPNGQSWVYETATNSWTAKGAVSGGMVYKGGIDITAAPPAAQSGWTYSITTGGTPNAGFTGLSGTLTVGTQVTFDGTKWQESGSSGPWTRTGTVLSPANAGDQVHTATGKLTVGGTAAAPNIEIKADGGIVANTDGLVYDAATKRLAIGTTSPSAKLTIADGAVSAGIVIPTSDIAFPSAYANGFFRAVGGYNVGGGVGGTIQLGGRSYTDPGNVGAFLISAVSGGNATDALTFSTQTSFNNVVSERMRLDSSGRLLVGTSTGSSDSTLVLQGNSSNATFNSVLRMLRDVTNPAADTVLGSIIYGVGSAASAGIECYADAQWAANDYPGRLVFSTTADGASSPTERMRLDRGGVLFNQGTFDTTTANGANMYIFSDGKFSRSTSSSKYKTQIEPIEDSYSDALLACRPVWYRSTCEADCPDHSYWGFIAEEVAQIDKRLVNWKTVDVSYDENGSVVKAPCDPEPEGVAYDRFVPHLLNLIKRQKEQIEAMEARLTALESA